MSGNQRQIITTSDWMRSVEKQIVHESRRPRVTNASDLLGPGIASYSVEIQDWNAEELKFNGFWWSQPGALHTPEENKWYMGYTEATQDGFGVQYADEFREIASDAWPPKRWMRRFYIPSAGGLTAYSAWSPSSGKDTVHLVGTTKVDADTAYVSTQFNIATVTLPSGSPWRKNGQQFQIHAYGEVTNDTAGSYTELFLRYGTGANVGLPAQQFANCIVDHRLAGRIVALLEG